MAPGTRKGVSAVSAVVVWDVRRLEIQRRWCSSCFNNLRRQEIVRS